MTKREIENIIREAISMILEIDDNKTIRFGWGTSTNAGSAPYFSRNQNVVIIFDTIVDDPINRTQEIDFDNGTEGKLNYINTHIDVHEFVFVCYGPDSFEWARNIRNNISMPHVENYLHKNNLFLIPDISGVQVSPELIDGEWWDRTDTKIRFNEKVYVKKENVVDAMEDLEIKALSADKTVRKEKKEVN